MGCRGGESSVQLVRMNLGLHLDKPKPLYTFAKVTMRPFWDMEA